MTPHHHLIHCHYKNNINFILSVFFNRASGIVFLRIFQKAGNVCTGDLYLKATHLAKAANRDSPVKTPRALICYSFSGLIYCQGTFPEPRNKYITVKDSTAKYTF